MKHSFFMRCAVLLVCCLGVGCDRGSEQEAEESLADSLQVTDLVVGTGQSVSGGDYVSAHYTGWLYVEGQKGEKFDSSVDRGEAFFFRLGRGMVIKGWDQGIEGMRVGGKRQLIVPPALGYGARGNPRIPPNSTLFFEVELVDTPEVGIEVLSEGTGGVAEEGDHVTVHYTGWILEDGQRARQFDSSYDRDQPLEFTLGSGQVIPGWDLGALGMKVGEKRTLTIPPILAYGSRGVQRGGQTIIPPDASLQFEVHMLVVLGK